MHIRRHPSSIALTLALPVALVFGALNPVAAQQPAPTATALPATPTCQPWRHPRRPQRRPRRPWRCPPTPEPTLTVPEAIDRILSGEKPVETLVTLFAWQPALLRGHHGAAHCRCFRCETLARARFLRWLDRKTGGQRRDLEEEVQREEEKKKVEAERRA
jgi:hypothetical protein